jgi:hypothetical protein
LRRLLDALVLEGAKALKVATEVRWSATRSLAVHSLMMHSLAARSSAVHLFAACSSLACWPAEHLSAVHSMAMRFGGVHAVVGGTGVGSSGIDNGGGGAFGGGVDNFHTVVGGAVEEGGGAFVGGGIENVAPSSEALALETALAVAATENFIVCSLAARKMVPGGGRSCDRSGGGVDGRDGGAFGGGIGDGIGGGIGHGGGGVKYFNNAIVGRDCSHVITAIGDIVDGRDSDGGTHSRRSAIQASIAATSAVRNTNRD